MLRDVKQVLYLYSSNLGFPHPDDIQIVKKLYNADSLEPVGDTVRNFATENFLKLNFEKSKVVMFGLACSLSEFLCLHDGSNLPADPAGK